MNKALIVPFLTISLTAFSPLGVSRSLAFEELPVSKELPPMTKPAPGPIGYEWHYINKNGEQHVYTTVKETTDTVTYESTDGCTWTKSNIWFSPATKWSKCPRTNSARVKFIKGEIWPLKVGNKFKFHQRGITSNWNGIRWCEVEEQVRVKIVAGAFDTFKVVCKDPWSTRTY